MRERLTTLGELTGHGCIAAGFGLISPAFGLISAGISLIFVCFVTSGGES